MFSEDEEPSEEPRKRGGQPGNNNRTSHGKYAHQSPRERFLALQAQAEGPAPHYPGFAPRPAVREPLRPFDQRIHTMFMLDMEGEGKTKNTLNQYDYTAHNFLLFCKERELPELEKLTKQDISQWMIYLRKERRYADASVRNRYTALKAFFTWCSDEQQRDFTGVFRNPMTGYKAPKAAKNPKDVVSKEDLSRLFQFLEEKGRWRDATVISLLYETGVRATELTNIRFGHFDPVLLSVWLAREDADDDDVHIKNDEGRAVPVSPKVVRYLTRYLSHPRRQPEWLLNSRAGKLTRHTVWEIVKRSFEQIGVTGSLHIGAHDMRHTSATHRAMTRKFSTQEMQDIYGWHDSKMAAWYTDQARKALAVQVMRENSLMEDLNTKKARLPSPQAASKFKRLAPGKGRA